MPLFQPSAVWGLDIGQFGVKAVKLKKTGEGAQIEAFDIIEFESMASLEEIGTADQIMSAVQTFIDRNSIGKSDRIYVSIAGRQVFSRFINLPPVEKKRIPEIVKYEARQQIPFDIEEVFWGYQPVQEEPAPGEEIEIGLFAIKREIIDDFLANLAALKLNLHGLQIAPLALYNFIRFDQDLSGPTVVLDVGAENTDLVVVDRDRFWLRNLPVAGNDITRAVQKKFNISFEEAEQIKRKAAQSKHAKQVFEIMLPVLRDLVNEIQRSIGYYKSLSKDVKFDELLVMGNAFRLAGMQKYMADNLQYQVRAMTALGHTTFGNDVDQQSFEENAMTMQIALGLAVQGIGASHMKIDLLPAAYAHEREIVRKKPVAAAVAACLFLGAGLSFFAELRHGKGYRVGTQAGHTALERARGSKKKHNQAQGKVQEAVGKLGRVAKFGLRRGFWAGAFPAIAKIVPKDVFLQTLRGGVNKDGQIEMVMKGELIGPNPSKQRLEEKLVKGLESKVCFEHEGVPSFKDVALDKVNLVEMGRGTAKRAVALKFEIRWVVRPYDEICAEAAKAKKET